LSTDLCGRDRILTVLKKEMQGKDKRTAQIVDNAKAFKVNLRLSINLRVRTCSLRRTQEKQTFET
jgi:hypothetical protein